MPYFPILQKPTQNNLITKTSFRQDAPSPWRKNRRREDCPIGAIHRHRRKTAEERFHTLARGWLAYPVTPTHLPSTAEERLYTSTHGRFALSRRRATALFRNPVRKAQRSVPGFSSTPTSACRRYATSPPSIGLRIHIVRHPSVCARGALHLVTPSARSDSGGRMGHRLAPSICAPAPTAQAVTPSVNFYLCTINRKLRETLRIVKKKDRDGELLC